MAWYQYIIPVLLSTFTGWFITWILPKMLFHPRKPIKIFGSTIQGIFPKNQQLIAEKLGQVVGKEFLSFTEIEAKVTNPENLEKLKPEIEKHIDGFLKNKIKEVFPMLAMFIGDKTINQLKAAFLMELETLFPVLMKSYMGKLQEDLNLEKMVTEKIAAISSEKLEEMVIKSTKKEFQFLQVIGAVFGFLMGLLQLLIALL